MSDDIYLIYIGKGVGTIYGVPARNLTEEEAAIHGEDRLLKSKLYVRAYPQIRETKRTRKLFKKEEGE